MLPSEEYLLRPQKLRHNLQSLIFQPQKLILRSMPIIYHSPKRCFNKLEYYITQ